MSLVRSAPTNSNSPGSGTSSTSSRLMPFCWRWRIVTKCSEVPCTYPIVLPTRSWGPLISLRTARLWNPGLGAAIAATTRMFSSAAAARFSTAKSSAGPMSAWPAMTAWMASMPVPYCDMVTSRFSSSK